MECIDLADDARTATLYVDCFQFRGCVLSATLPGEAAVVATMIGAPIDPDVLREQATVSDSLSTIAINTSNFCCAELSRVYRGGKAPPLVSTTLVAVCRPKCTPATLTGGPAAVGHVPDCICAAPPTFASLPTSIVAQIACMTGMLRLGKALACTCRMLHSAFDGLALPVWELAAGVPPCITLEQPTRARPSLLVVRNARHGHGMVALTTPLRRSSALVGLHLCSLDYVGGIQLGIAAVQSDGGGRLQPAASVDQQLWFDGCGRLTVGAAIRPSLAPPPPRLYGDRMRAGDRLVMLYDGATASVGLFAAGQHSEASPSDDCDGGLHDPLRPLGAMVSLRRPRVAAREGYVLCVRFDSQAGLAVALDASRRSPLDVAVLSRAVAPPRPLQPGEPQLLVRTIGPDAVFIGVHADLRTASVGELRELLAKALYCEAHEVELRIRDTATGRDVLRLDAQCQSGAVCDTQLAASLLCKLGVRLEANGAHLHQLYAHMPHLIS